MRDTNVSALAYELADAAADVLVSGDYSKSYGAAIEDLTDEGWDALKQDIAEALNAELNTLRMKIFG